jgi:hypothetical protein
MSILLKGPAQFRIRFNTKHNGNGLFWRVIVENTEYLASSISCKVHTYSDSSFDHQSNEMKYNIAGTFNTLIIDENNQAILE